MEPADVTFGLCFRILVEVHLLNSPLQVDVERRHGDILSPVALSSGSLEASVLLCRRNFVYQSFFERWR